VAVRDLEGRNFRPAYIASVTGSLLFSIDTWIRRCSLAYPLFNELTGMADVSPNPLRVQPVISRAVWPLENFSYRKEIV
jgi:hypothetical protein